MTFAQEFLCASGAMVKIGPRQTVDHARHPDLGEGRMVYRNGPTFFIADSGEVIEFAEKFVGYHGTKNPLGGHDSFLVVTQDDGAKIELDITGREHGKTHYRIKTRDGALGWLVSWSTAPYKIDHRWEPDNGDPEELEMRSSRVWYSWIEMTRRDGKKFVYKVIDR